MDKYFSWNVKKNEDLKRERQISFEAIVFHIQNGGLLDIITHPNQSKYQGQRIFIVNVNDYAYLVPFVEDDNIVFLKTIIPNRKATKRYLRTD